MRLLAPLLALPLLLAGCVTPPLDAVPGTPASDDAAGEVWARVRDLLEGVPCEADVSPEETSGNLLDLSHLAFAPESGEHAEMDVRGDLALVARYQAGGLEVVSLADPTNLSLVATLEIPETAALDVKWMPAGDAAVIGDFAKVHLVDLRDPAAPALLSTFHYEGNTTQGQAHMLATFQADDGREFVYVATQSGNLPLLVLEREGANLALAGSYAFTPLLVSDPALGQHDMTVYHDELLDKPILYVAEGLLGWSAADLSDPAKPTRIGGTLSPEPGTGYTHTVRVQFVEGKRIVVTMAEVGLNTLKVYDATDLQAPVLLARWNADPARPNLPQHNIQLHEGLLYMAHYTEGLYVFDLNGVMRGPPVLGTLDLQPIAHHAVAQKRDGGVLGFANVWEVVLSKGVIYLTDRSEGLSSVGFGCLAPGDEAITATA